MSGLTSAATRFTESEQEVQPPVNIGHIQWLDMQHWKERRAAGEAAWEQWYPLGDYGKGWDDPEM